MFGKLSPAVMSSVTIFAMRGSMLLGKMLLSIFIARFLGLDVLGLYGLVIAGAGLVQALLKMGVGVTIARDSVRLKPFELTQQIWFYCVGLLILYIPLLAGGMLYGYVTSQLLLFCLVCIVFFAEHLIYDIFILFNNLQRPKAANFLLVLQSASWIYSYIILACFFESLRILEYILIFWIVGSMLSFIVTTYFLKKWPWRQVIAQGIKWPWYPQMIQRSWRLYLNNILGNSNHYVDRFLIATFINIEVTGVYVLFSQAINAIEGLVDASVIKVYKPKMIQAWGQQKWDLYKELFKQGLIKSLMVTAGLCLIVGLLMPLILKGTSKILAEEYLPFFWLLLLILHVKIISGCSISGLFAAYKDNEVVLSAFFCLMIILIIGSISLSFIGIYGVLITMFLSSLCAIIPAWRLLKNIRNAPI